MSDNGLGKKLLVVGAVVGVLFLVGRLLGGGEEDGIDRIDTGNERNEDNVDTGLDRVDTADDEGESNAADEDDESEADDDADTSVPVETGGRLDNLDLFDYVAILGAAFKAAKSEYDTRT